MFLSIVKLHRDLPANSMNHVLYQLLYRWYNHLRKVCRMVEDISLLMSFIYNKNINGPNTVAWFAPLHAWAQKWIQSTWLSMVVEAKHKATIQSEHNYSEFRRIALLCTSSPGGYMCTWYASQLSVSIRLCVI